MTPVRRIFAGVILVLLGLASALATAEPVTATTVTSDQQLQERTVVLGSDGMTSAAFEVDRLAPGSTVRQPFRLHVGGDIRSGRPAVRLAHVRDFERGCLHPETAAGDITCGIADDQGELSTQLLTGVSWHSAGPDGCASDSLEVAALTMSAASGVTQAATQAVALGEADTCVVLTLTLPMSADNLVQSDSVQFELQIGLLDARHRGDIRSPLSGAADGSATELLPSSDSPSSGLLHHPVLPFTGLPMVPFVLLTIGVTVGGLGAMALDRPIGRTAT